MREREPLDASLGAVRRIDNGREPDRLPTGDTDHAPGRAHVGAPIRAPEASGGSVPPPAPTSDRPVIVTDWPWQPERVNGVGRVDRADHVDRVDRVDHADRTDHVDRVDRADRVDRVVDDRPGAVGTAPPRARHRRPSADDAGVEANGRLTGTTAVVLLVLFAIEGVTVLQVHSLLTAHVFVGMLLIPPVLLKIGSTGWRFARYYLGSPAYRRKGPPPPLLRLLGPVVVVLTLSVLGTGVALLLGPPSWRTAMLFLHKATFVVWLGAMGIHVLGHLLDTARLAPRDFVHRTRRQVDGASARQWAVAASLAVGLVLAVLVVPSVGHWLTAGVVVPGF